MPRSMFLGALLGSSLVLSSTGSARADEAADTAAARVLGGDGIVLADNGDCQQAIEKLRRAEELHHAPTTAGRLGECEISVGHLVDGTERLQRLLREPVAPNEPAAFVEALSRARRVLERALPRIAGVRVSVRAPTGTKLHVTIDGEKLPEALLDNNRFVDPGHHTIVASASGFLQRSAEVTLGEGETTNVTLELQPDPNAPPPPKLGELQQPAAAAAESPPTKSGVGPAVITAFTAGGLGLAAGIAGGAIVAIDAADLSKTCGADRVCPSNKQSELSSARTWATVSTVGFSIAGVGLGTGLLLLTLGGHESHPSTEASIRPVFGPLYIGCEGSL